MKTLEIKPDQVTPVPLSALSPDPEQPRKNYAEGPLQELADDIAAREVQEPIKIRQGDEGQLFIVKGERRFRASQLALKTTIPCLLEHDNEEDPAPGLSRLLGQVKENHLREGLNPIEWALFLKKLRDEHGIKIANMEDFLKKNAIHNMSRSYISNLIRLVELPDWAQQLIVDGTFTAAHGKYLLMAKFSDEAMAQVKRELEESGDLSECTTEDVHSAVFDAIADTQQDLSGANFNTDEVCKKCANKKTIKSPFSSYELDFCLNVECYKENQLKAADQATKERRSDKNETANEPVRQPPTKVKANKQGVVDVDKYPETYVEDDYVLLEEATFDKTGCQDCKHNKKACGREIDFHLFLEEGTREVKNVCFDVACFQEKTEAHDAEDRRIRPFVRHVATRLRNYIITTHVAIDTTLQLNLLSFMALEYPINKIFRGEERIVDDNDRDSDEDIVEQVQIKNITDVLTRGTMGHLAQIARHCVLEMGRGSLGLLAKFLDVKVEQIIKTDKDLLELFDKQTLISLVPEKHQNSAALEKAIKGEKEDLYPFFNDDSLSGENIPEDIRLAFSRIVD